MKKTKEKKRFKPYFLSDEQAVSYQKYVQRRHRVRIAKKVNLNPETIRLIMKQERRVTENNKVVLPYLDSVVKMSKNGRYDFSF